MCGGFSENRRVARPASLRPKGSTSPLSAVIIAAFRSLTKSEGNRFGRRENPLFRKSWPCRIASIGLFLNRDGIGVRVTGIDLFTANENFLRIVFDDIVGIVGAIGHGHAAPGMRGSVRIRSVIATVVK